MKIFIFETFLKVNEFGNKGDSGISHISRAVNLGIFSKASSNKEHYFRRR